MKSLYRSFNRSWSGRR